MFEQLTQLVQQYGGDAVVNNTAVPNEHNEAVIQETSSSIFSGLQKIASEGGTEQLAGLFNGTSKLDSSNPVVQQITQQLSGSLGEKFGLSSTDSAGVASSMIPQVLNSLVNKAKDPNDSSFNISDIISSISGNSGQASGIMETINKYGMQFGLDQNNDGKVDVADAVSLTKSGGLGGLLGKLFGK
ncbi:MULTISPECIES: hypothetical protein [Flavobacterium]|uniref:DUF937 domain-containing protein n=1 Tax=Flavobacterium tructae TaxID=1114873 RepID=A0A1S1J8K8_9FLAO|nr:MULTISPECIES: hypothetical protein [Flavobacterium]MDL2142128.1 hypothetical protein [Flavobacterium tructae]OHT45496.1 hypothetical protein BHE19_06560 [Flavobacterium tructae]OXB18155.1 hypothetical protein B0A71_14575 [Flavobacterium tructae]URC10918.1 hypothetical protein M4I44_12530 [Flavobacterium sp. B183]